MSIQLSEQELLRRASRSYLLEQNISPYPAASFEVSHLCKEVLTHFEDKIQVKMAGRMMSRRVMGKAAFFELQDSTDRLQVYVNRDEICKGENKEWYNTIFKKHIDIGDFLGVEGYLFKTQTGEISIHAENIILLSKSLKPLPMVKIDKDGFAHDQVQDPEFRYRQRYVDLVTNPKVKEVFVKRSKMIQAMRDFFNQKNYLEVDTPVLQAIAGGAAARPFSTHHNALDIPFYLRISNELYLKRLIVGGFDGVYEFSRNFRNEGMDRTHNPEFTILEIYIAYKDYHWMMDFTEQLLEKVALVTNQSTESQFGPHLISFKAPFKRISMREAILEHTGFDIDGKTEEMLFEFAQKNGIEVDEKMGKGKLIDEIFGTKCEKKYIQPTFITDYPIEMSPLAKRHRNNPELTERFELIIGGKEVANAYSELNDPIDQRARFEEQMRLGAKGDDEAMMIDQDFLRALEYGMPPTGGLGIGVDRLAMYLTGQESIQEVLFFPQMRPEKFHFVAEKNPFESTGVPKNWALALAELFEEKNIFQNQKPTQIHQKLSGYRKKNKLEDPLPSLEEIEKWQLTE